MNDIENSQSKGDGTKPNSNKSTSSKNSAKVKPGDQYVVDGAIFKCQYGATPSQILVASNQKVMAQGKAIASDKDVTFKIATAPFTTCTQNKSPQGPTCIYAKGNFDKSTTVKHGNITALTEKSTMMCPIFAGEISCVFPGQTKAVSATDFTNVEIKTLSNFPLALVVTFPDFNDDESPKKVANVKSVSVSKKLIRINDEITLHAYKQDKQKDELVYPNSNNWVFFTTKQLEENKEKKVKKGTYIDDLKIFRHVSSPFITILHKPGTYHIEACGEKTLEKYYELNSNTPLQIVNNKTVPSFYKNCEVVVDVVANNRIVDIKMDNKAISNDKKVYVKQGKEALFSPKFLLDFDSEIDELKLSIKDSRNNADLTECFKLEAKGQDFAFTPLVAEKDYSISFSLFKKENGTVEETAISEKSFTLHSYNDAVLFAYVPESSSQNKPSYNVTLKRPQEGLAFTVKVKDKNADLGNVEWRLKKDDKYVNEIVKSKGEMALYFFNEEGHYEIEADLTNTNYCNGGVEGNGINSKGRDVSQRVITHKFEISENYVTALKMASTNGKRYVGVKYTINPEFLFGTDTFACEKKDVVYKADGADENYLRQGIFFATEPGAYTVEAILNGKTKSETFTIEETTFVSWDFCDSNRRRINAIGRDMEFGINGSVPAWALVGDKNSKENTPKRNIYVGLYVKDRMINSFKSEVDCDGNFHVEGIDVEKDVIMNLHSTDNKDNFTLTFKVLGCPTNIVKGLQMSEKKELFADGHNLIVTKDFRIEGYFAHADGRRLVEIMDYESDVNVHLRILNASQDDLNKLRLRVYENKSGMDPVVFESSEITLDKNGNTDIPIKIKENREISAEELDSLKFPDKTKNKSKVFSAEELDSLKFPEKKESEETTLPRLFYFMVVKLDAFGIIQNSQYAYIDDFAKKYVYPPCPGDLYNYNAKELETLVDNEKFDLLKYDSEFQKKSKARNYYYQLKLVSKKENNDYTNTYNKFGLVVVGEDWEKEEKTSQGGGKCPRCNEDAEKMLERVKAAKLFSEKANDKLKIICDTYCKYMRKLHMDTCWIKAHFFAQIYIESGANIEAKDENLSKYERDTPGNKNALENVFASRIFEGNFVGEGENRHWESVHNYSKEMKDKVSNDNRVYRTDNNAKKRLDLIYSTTSFGTPQRDKALADFVYEGVNGNKKGTNDGSTYKGGGYIQITGRENYQKVADTINAIVSEEEKKSFNLMKGAKELNDNVALSTLASMVYLYRRNIYMRLYADNKMSYVANGQKNTLFVNKLVGKVCSKTIIDEESKEKISSTNYKEKQKAFDKLAKAFEVDSCDWGEEFTESTEDKNIYRIDLDKFSFFQYQKNSNSNEYVYKMYNKGEKIREFMFTAQKIKGDVTAVPFPETSEDAENDSVKCCNIKQELIPHWGRYSVRDKGGDNWASPHTCAALLGFFYSLPLNGYNGTLYYNDISCMNGSGDHFRHKYGNDIDIRYPGSKGGSQELWDGVVETYYKGDESAFLVVFENILVLAQKWYFKENFAQKDIKGGTLATYAKDHQHHFHMSNMFYKQLSKQ